MDANGTRYHLLLGEADWRRCVDENGRPALAPAGAAEHESECHAEWESVSQNVTLRKRLYRFPDAPGDPVLERSARRGAGRDRYGNWYWIGESRREILVLSSGDGSTTQFWPGGSSCRRSCSPQDTPFEPVEPPVAPGFPLLSGLAITEDHYLVVGTLEPKGLLIFDLHAPDTPEQSFWPKDVDFAPFDMAPRPGGGVWILDRDNARYWELDRYFRVRYVDGSIVIRQGRKDTFQPEGGPETRKRAEVRFAEGVSLETSSPLAFGNAVAIEALPDGSVLLLESDPGQSFSTVYRYRDGAPLGDPVSLETASDLLEDAVRPSFRLRAHDFAFVAATDRLYVVGDDGNQAFVFQAAQDAGGQLRLEPLNDYMPMRLFGGKALIAAGGRAFYDFGDCWIPLIAQNRRRYETDATLILPRLDGREPGCVWHRLMLDACIPPETDVQISSSAADDPARLTDPLWFGEPHVYPRGDGSELPFAQPGADGPRRTWELLFQQARGRYLKLKIAITGSRRSTPHLHALRVYYPRFSYLTRYFPTVYREEPSSASFLDRFLANMEGLFTATEDRIAAIQALMDVRSAPPEAIEWLGSWFGIALDPKWEDWRRRLFLRHAVTFFQFRGTPAGITMALRLVLDSNPGDCIFDVDTAARGGTIRIVESFRTRTAPPVALGDASSQGPAQYSPKNTRWSPGLGRADLNKRYGSAYPVIRPAGAQEAADWEAFSTRSLGFIPAPETARRRDLWHGYLARRYSKVAAMNLEYGRTDADFDSVPYPATLPPDGAQLQDWFEFQAVVVPSWDTAHKFTVLLPMPRIDTPDSAPQQARLELASRLIALEKPAHTSFQVKFYWAMFRVGEARLGLDTAIETGSRDPQLLPPAAADRTYIAESYLAARYPLNLRDRRVLQQGSCQGD